MVLGKLKNNNCNNGGYKVTSRIQDLQISGSYDPSFIMQKAKHIILPFANRQPGVY